ncbi:MAG: radical SAM family heme chaperone HemW [Rikenellaceae bacterium]
MSALYLHIPFCRRLCGYCDFFKSVKHDRMAELFAAMMVELESERVMLSSNKLRTIYFGGGTPSLMSADQVTQFMERIAALYDVSGVEEVTFEANPDDITPEYLRALRSVGINRLSLGVQSFDDATLRFMNRRHDAAQAVQAIQWAREAGFGNIAIDLIFGVSGFGGDVLKRSLEQAIALNVEHIAAYHLTIEPGTEFARRVSRGDFAPVAESVSEEEYELVRRMLSEEGGFDHYEISNYAKDGHRSLHNSSYWSGSEYLGIGAGAHSFFAKNNIRRWACDSIDEYLCGERYGSENLTLDDRRNEVIMTSLRRKEGINILNFGEVFGVEQQHKLLADAGCALECGDLLLESIDGVDWLRIPSERFLRSDMVIEQLFNI